MRQQDGRGARRHREGERVAEAIGEKELGDRVANVVLGEAEERFGIELVGEREVGVGVHRALRPAGRAGGVEPEADVVAHRRRGDGFGPGAGKQILEAGMAVRLLAGHDDMLEIFAGADRLGKFGIELFGHDQEPRAAVVEHEAVIVLGQQRVDRHRHHAGLDRAEKGGRPVDRIDETEERALLAAHAERAQHVAEALDPFSETAVGPAPALIDIGDLAGPAGVEIALENIGARSCTRAAIASPVALPARFAGAMFIAAFPSSMPHYADGGPCRNPLVVRLFAVTTNQH